VGRRVDRGVAAGVTKTGLGMIVVRWWWRGERVGCSALRNNAAGTMAAVTNTRWWGGWWVFGGRVL